MKKLILILLCSVVLGCQSLEILTPAPVVDSPESPGRKALSGEVFAGPATLVEVTSNAGNRPPDLTDNSIGQVGMLGATGDYGFTDQISLGISYHTVDVLSGYLFFKAKYQPFGSSFQKPQPGFNLAVWGRGGTGWASASGDQEETFGSGGYPWSGSISDKVLGVGTSFGYRFNKYFMSYLGVARDWHDMSADISQDEAKGTAGGSYNAKFTGEYTSAALGLQYTGKKFRFGIQGVYTEFLFNEIERSYDNYFGISLAVLFERGNKKSKRKKRKPKYIEVPEGEQCVDDDEYECVDAEPEESGECVEDDEYECV